MENQELYSLGEVVDNMEKDVVFVSLFPKDEGAAFKANEDGWLTVRYAGEDYFTTTINIRYYDDVKIKRYTKMTIEEFNALEENKNGI